MVPDGRGVQAERFRELQRVSRLFSDNLHQADSRRGPRAAPEEPPENSLDAVHDGPRIRSLRKYVPHATGTKGRRRSEGPPPGLEGTHPSMRMRANCVFQ